MTTSNPRRYRAPALAAHEEVGILSFDRWGVGSLVTIGGLLGTGSILLLRWSATKGWFSLLLAALLFVGGAVVLVVKAVENIERVQFRGYDPVGKIGTVVVAMGGRATGSVRVDGLDWSATSMENLRVGEEVLIVSREGLHIFVRKPKPQAAV